MKHAVLKGVLIAVWAASSAASSAAYAASPASSDALAIRQILDDTCAAFIAKNLDGVMAAYKKDAVLFDSAPPQQLTVDELKEGNRQFLAAMASKPSCEHKEVYIKVYGKWAYARYLMPFSVTLAGGVHIEIENRGTDIFEKADDKWVIVHEHISVPVDPMTARAQLTPPTSEDPRHTN